MKHSRWTAAAVTFGILAYSTIALGLDPTREIHQYVSRQWSIEDGMPQASSFSLLQTKDDYLWVGTLGGLSRFDGLNFETFESADLEGVQFNQIYAIHEDRQGRLWVGGAGGLVCLDKGKATKYGEAQGLGDNLVTTVFEDNNGVIYVGTHGGFYRLESDQRFVNALKRGKHKKLFITSSLAEKKHIWLGTSEGLMRFRSNKIVETISTKEGLPSNMIRGIIRDSAGDLVVATDNGLVIKKGKQLQILGTDDGFSAIVFRTLINDSNDTVWIGEDNTGLYRLREGKVEKATELLGTDVGVTSLTEDKEGNLWVGTNGRGLFRIKDGKLYTVIPDRDRPDAFILGLYEDSEGTVWYGMNNGFVSEKDGKTTRYLNEDVGLKGMVLSFSEVSKGTIWVSSHGGGMVLLKNGEPVRTFAKEDGLADDRVRGLMRDRQNRLWIGTSGGLSLMENGKITQSWDVDDGMRSPIVIAFHQTPDDTIYIGTQQGLCRIRKNRVHCYKEEAAPKDFVSHITDDGQGNIWIAGGSTLLLLQDGKFISLTKEHGLTGLALHTMTIDNLGIAWFSSNIGIQSVPYQHLLDVAEGRASSFTLTKMDTADGMRNRECNSAYFPSVIKTKGGKIIVPSLVGAVVIDPTTMSTNKKPPTVHITSLTADNKTIDRDALLPAGSERLSFQFVGISYSAPEKVRYQYMLEGSDPKFVDSGSAREAFYMNLDPGEYRFKVRAVNRDGVWSKEDTVFPFTLEAHWYQTIWFLLGLALFIGVLVTTTVFAVIRISRKRDKELNELAWSRTRKVLEGQVGNIRHVSERVSDVSQTLQELMLALSSSAKEVSAAITETATTVGEMEVTGRKVEQNAHQIVRAANQTKEGSVRGRQSVARSTELMNFIQSDSSAIVDQSQTLRTGLAEVDNITRAVKEIADQSKILAVNASIEASKAGKAGQGFVVVSNQMKELAGQSKQSTIDISELLGTLRTSINRIANSAKQGQTRTEEGVDAISNSGGIVSILSEEIEVNAELAEMIATSVAQQITGLKQIGAAITQIDHSASENLHVSSQVDSATRELNESIEELTSLIEDWQTPDFYR